MDNTSHEISESLLVKTNLPIARVLSLHLSTFITLRVLIENYQFKDLENILLESSKICKKQVRIKV